MDRLPVVTLGLASLLAGSSCEERREAAPAERVNAVKATGTKTASVESFCDYVPKAPMKFAYPKLAADAPAAPAGTWRWVNVWATWCKPCIEEMPRLQKFESDLERDGRKVKLVFVSADENEDDVKAFRAKHKELPDGPRIADEKELAAWKKTLGVDEGAPIPIHIWVDPENNVRCVRAGGVRDKDYASIQQVVTTAK